ncbi:hypothetical protein DPMN_076024 [Dreissena polymorpha]|uniref:Uncharacterized protein n=1 Tax=Dreissena polymorpha TaxID=45954 RepID=A0A9D4BN90_DREPO|nr:hypothetical protein DPMN_076024 [Dreissena polymorpha]
MRPYCARVDNFKTIYVELPLKGQGNFAKGSLKKKTFFALLYRNAAFMASLDATSRRPEPQNGFPSTLSVLSTAVLGHFHYLHRATPAKSWPVSLPKVRPVRPIRCHLHCSRLSSGDVVKPTSTYGQLPFRLAILPSSGSQRSQRKGRSGSRDDGTRLIHRVVRRSSPILPSSDDEVKPLSTYPKLPFLFAICRSLQKILVILAQVATCTLQLLIELF